MRSRLMWVASTVIWAHGDIQIPAAAEGQVWSLGPAAAGSVLTSLDHVTNEAHVDYCELGCLLKLCW